MTKLGTTMLAAVAATLAGLSFMAGCTAEQATSTGDGQTFNNADVTFAQQMIMHHRQAITMAQVAQTQAEDPRVRHLAAQIIEEQTREITTMTNWLHAWGKPVPTTTPGTAMLNTASSMPHPATMPPHTPMMSEHMPTMTPHPDASQLMGMHGAHFDHMFLQMMISHHENAIAAAKTELASGKNPAARRLAQNIQTSQGAQISQMRQILATPSPTAQPTAHGHR